ncbi:MAG: ankyrin repeat domain-containing protein [Candidatus Sumerlaeaceae bacterium]
MLAADVGSKPLLELFIKQGVSFESCTTYGRTALHFAVIASQRSAAEKLLDAGSKIEVPDMDGFRPLHLASLHSDERMIELLLRRGADIDALTGKRQTNTDKVLSTALHIASHRGNDKIARLLLKAGADPNKSNGWGDTAVHLAAEPNLLEAISRDIIMSQKRARKMVELLVESGADINVLGAKGSTALHTACAFQRYELTKLLLANGADPNIADDEGELPIDALEDGESYSAFLKTLGVKLSHEEKHQLEKEKRLMKNLLLEFGSHK